MKGYKTKVRAFKMVTKLVLVKDYPSMLEAAHDLEVDPSNVRRAMNGEIVSAKGYTFKKI